MNKKFLTAIISLFVVASSILALNGLNGSTSAATIDNTPDCDTVAIIKCGAFSESELRTDATKTDVPKVMTAFGISQSELSGMVNGVVWKDGRVTVGDKTVATGAVTAGRWNNPTSDMTRIAGTDRAYKMSTSHFVTDGQTAFVKMVNGQFSFAVIKSCGNPVTAKPVATPKPPTPAPTYACSSLKAVAVDRDTYRFDATGTTANGAKITAYSYNFGDGKTISNASNGKLTDTTTHSYTKPGTYTARVTLAVFANNKSNPATAAACTARVTVTAPPTTPPKEECKPGIPVGDERCEEKPEECKPGIPVGDDRCEDTPPVTPPETPETPEETPPAVIPDTGPADLAIGGVGLGSLAGAGYYWRTSRRNLISKLLNR